MSADDRNGSSGAVQPSQSGRPVSFYPDDMPDPARAGGDYVPSNREVLAHFRGNLGVDMRWNILFRILRCPFSMMFSEGENSGIWLPAIANWRDDDRNHGRLLGLIHQHPLHRFLGTGPAYDAVLRQMRGDPETRRTPRPPEKFELVPLVGEASSDPGQLVAHIAALQKVSLSSPPFQPLLGHGAGVGLRHSPRPGAVGGPPRLGSSPPASRCWQWADLLSYVFDLQPLAGLTSPRLRSLRLQSNRRRERVVVLVGTPTEGQAKDGHLHIAGLPCPETAWQEAAWYLSYNPRWQVAGNTILPNRTDSIPAVLGAVIAQRVIGDWVPNPNGYPLAELVHRTGVLSGVVGKDLRAVRGWLAGTGKPVELAVASILRANGFSNRLRTKRKHHYWNRDEDWA